MPPGVRAATGYSGARRSERAGSSRPPSRSAGEAPEPRPIRGPPCQPHAAASDAGAGHQSEPEEIAAAEATARVVSSWLGNLPRYQPVIIARSEAGSTRKTRATWRR